MAKKAKADKPIDNVEELTVENNSDTTETTAPVIDDLRMPEDKPSRWQAFKAYTKTHRTRLILMAGLILILPAAGYAYYEQTRPTEVVAGVVVKKHTKPVTKVSPLTGLSVEPERAERPITSVIIENHPDARPQSGLADAGVVYEALAEGGITRFQAFFLENRPATLGPVRSLRTYFVDWALEFAAPVAHVGGNADALDLVDPLHMKDMNEFVHGDSFYRSTDRVAPHNAYTSSDALDRLEKQLGYDTAPTFTPSPRKADTKPTAPPAHPDINIDYSYNGYQVEYKYNGDCNCYDRFLDGQPHIDRNTGQQIQVKNVVVEYMPTDYGTTRIGEQTVMMGTPGSGTAIVFEDGGAIEGTWNKASHADRTKLQDAAGKDIPLNRGNTWYSIVPTTKTVSY